MKWKAIINIVRIVFIAFSFMSAIYICISIYLINTFGKASVIEIIESSDGPTTIFIDKKNNDINGMDLFYNDYVIIKYDEHKTYKNVVQMNFNLKIINSEKLNILENDVIPIMYVNINNKRYYAKGQLSVLPTFPEGCDCMFPINNDGKIEFFENQIIYFLGFENREE